MPLVVEAFGGLPSFDDVDTGTLAGDLKAMLRGYLELFNKTSLATVLPALASERGPRSRARRALRPGAAPAPLAARRGARTRASRAARSPPTLDLELAADLIVGPIAVRLFFTGRRILPKLVDPMVEMALDGIRAHRSV